MNAKLLTPAVGLLLLGGSALALADDGWRHDRHPGPERHGWQERGWGHSPPPRWRGPAYYYGPRYYEPRWCPPRGYGYGPPRPYYRPSAWGPTGWGGDGLTIILRSDLR
jgi:hypothetical protein